MFDMSFGEMTLLAAIALIAIGPKQLPEVARVAGKMLADLRRTTNDFTRSFLEARESTSDILNDARNHLNQAHQEIVQHLTVQDPFAQPTEQPLQTLDHAAHGTDDGQHSFPLHTLDPNGHDVHGVHGIHTAAGDDANQMKFDLNSNGPLPNTHPTGYGSNDPNKKDS